MPPFHFDLPLVLLITTYIKRLKSSYNKTSFLLWAVFSSHWTHNRHRQGILSNFEATILTSAKDSSTLSCFLSRYDEDTTLLCDGKDADCGMSVRGSF